MLSVEQLQAGLNTEFLGREVKYQDQTLSTNDDAWICYQNHESEGTLIFTEEQKHGRGRRQGKWISSPGKSLTFSFLLHPEMPFKELGIFSLLAGVSIVKGIHDITKIQAGLKWPNDIILNHKKMGGILIESHTEGAKLGIVVGIGLNINESQNDIPENLQMQATSLSIYSGKEFCRELILAVILNEFEKLYLYHWHEIIPLWQKYCIHVNQEVTFHDDNELHAGTFLGITDRGHAEIQIDGKTEFFSSGVVTL